MSYGIAPPQYRLPESTHLGTVSIQVSDLARSLEFYQRILGFSIVDTEPHHASLGPIGASSGLLRLDERAGAQAVPRGGRLGLYHFALLLPDRPSLGRFVTHLSKIGARASSADHAVSEAIYLWDPDGLGIEVYADRPRSEWRVRGNELFMISDPLDVDDVMRAAGEQSWDGLPSGTVLGHMHLHVGDLDRAEAFYHAALGLDKIVWSYPGALFLSAGGYHHHLATNTWAAGARPAGLEEARLLEWDLVLPSADDVERAARSLTSHRYDVRPDERGQTAADPWGTRLRLRTA